MSRLQRDNKNVALVLPQGFYPAVRQKFSFFHPAVWNMKVDGWIPNAGSGPTIVDLDPWRAICSVFRTFSVNQLWIICKFASSGHKTARSSANVCVRLLCPPGTISRCPLPGVIPGVVCLGPKVGFWMLRGECSSGKWFAIFLSLSGYLFLCKSR